LTKSRPESPQVQLSFMSDPENVTENSIGWTTLRLGGGNISKDVGGSTVQWTYRLSSMQIFSFAATALLIVGGFHYYIWVRLARDTGLPGQWSKATAIVLIGLALSLPTSLRLMRTLPLETARFVVIPIHTWLGVMVLTSTFLFIGDLVRLGIVAIDRLRHRERRGVDDPSSRLSARLQAGSALVATMLITILSVWNASFEPMVRRVEIGLPRLPKEMDKTTIVQISDLHLGLVLGRDWLERVIDQVNGLKPDVVAITGDLVDMRVANLAMVVPPLGNLKAKYGVFFVTGNHEYYSGAGEWVEWLTQHGIHVLRNERVTIGDQRASYDLAGIDDVGTQGVTHGVGGNLLRALEGRDPGRVLVLLSHQPRVVLEASRLGVSLQLSGHTHGGQFWPWYHLVALAHPVLSGLARFGDTWLYVNPGTGFWGPPMRLGTRSEITHVILRQTSGPRR